jgi:AraC family transcriptional regulator
MTVFQVREQHYAPGLRMASHAHATPSMSILLRGSLRESTRRRSEIAFPMSVSFMGADIGHIDEFGPAGATLLQVHFYDIDADFADACRRLNDWTWTHGGSAAKQFLRLASAASRSSDLGVTEQLIVDVLAAGSSDDPARGSVPAWLVDVRELIDDTYGWPRVADLAATARVHRVYLARQFRRFYGCSVSDYIRRRRVQAAALRIQSRTTTLSETAHACGFHDHAHMCRAFRRESAMSPSEFNELTAQRCCDSTFHER